MKCKQKVEGRFVQELGNERTMVAQFQYNKQRFDPVIELFTMIFGYKSLVEKFCVPFFASIIDRREE